MDFVKFTYVMVDLFKVALWTSKKIDFLQWKPFKDDEKHFKYEKRFKHFILKALFLLNIFKCLSWLLVI